MTLLQEAIPSDNNEIVELPLGEQKTCEQCRQPFAPRARTGGSPQRFCSADCRAAFHKTEAQRGQRSPAYSAEPTPPAVLPPPEKDTPLATAEDFDWTGDSVLLSEQPATAVYFNNDNALVIRRHRPYPDDDVWIVISAENIDRFLDKLTDACGVPSFP
jgi:hypothetical protein